MVDDVSFVSSSTESPTTELEVGTELGTLVDVVDVDVVDVVDVVVEVVVVVVDVVVVDVVVVVEVVVVVVVVGTTFRVPTAVAEYWVAVLLIPSWPRELNPQQRTCPVDITAQPWLAPATTSTTVPVNPSTTPGVALPVVAELVPN